jgi:hypothetical protein
MKASSHARSGLGYEESPESDDPEGEDAEQVSEREE